jgi:hypothetical protein
MSLRDDLAVFDPVSDVQSAYDESARTVFNESELRPWTISRHSVAIALGCKLASAVGPFVAEFLETGSYDNVFRDVVIVLYLSSLSDDNVLALDAKLNVQKAMSEAYSWAERHGVAYGSQGFISGVAILDKILRNILSSFFEVEHDSELEVKKKDIDHPGKFRLRGQPVNQAESQPKESLLRCLWRKLFNGNRSIIVTSENMP